MKKMRIYVGLGLHILVASVILYSAIIKFLGRGDPPEKFKEYILYVAVAELVNALLLLIPRTMSVGILLTSAGWGVVIAASLFDPNAPLPPIVPTGFLIVTWIGGYLRDRRMLYSFSPPNNELPDQQHRVGSNPFGLE